MNLIGRPAGIRPKKFPGLRISTKVNQPKPQRSRKKLKKK